jgi:hypothetical protein
VLCFWGLAHTHHPWWGFGTFAVALNLVVTSLTDRCVARALLHRLGVREREDLFLPGGVPKPVGRDALSAGKRGDAVQLELTARSPGGRELEGVGS